MRRIVAVTGMALAAAACASGGGRGSPGLLQLVEAERAFSRTAEEIGGRRAFLAWMDEEVVQYAPGPRVGLEELRTAPDFRRAFAWAPELAEIATAGDLGYTTGPVRSTGPEGDVAYSRYFSVWRGDGSEEGLRVVLDIGTSLPGEVRFPPPAVETPGTPSAREPAPPAPKARAPRDQLLELEQAFQEAYLRGGASSAYEEHGAGRLRLFRDDAYPVEGLARAVERVRSRGEDFAWTTGGGDASASGDLGYTWGSVLGRGEEVGGFVRVWRRDTSDAWRIVAEVVNAPAG